jgi:hypothetical protein
MPFYNAIIFALQLAGGNVSEHPHRNEIGKKISPKLALQIARTSKELEKIRKESLTVKRARLVIIKKRNRKNKPVVTYYLVGKQDQIDAVMELLKKGQSGLLAHLNPQLTDDKYFGDINANTVNRQIAIPPAGPKQPDRNRSPT